MHKTFLLSPILRPIEGLIPCSPCQSGTPQTLVERSILRLSPIAPIQISASPSSWIVHACRQYPDYFRQCVDALCDHSHSRILCLVRHVENVHCVAPCCVRKKPGGGRPRK